MQERRVLISVSPLGAVSIDAQGFTGNSCETATRAFEEVFVGNSSKSHKPEYYESSETDKNTLMF